MKRKKAGLFTKLVIVALIIYAGATLTTLYSQIQTAKERQSELLQQIENKTVSNANLQYALDHSDEDATIEGIAREKLGLVNPGEKVFYSSGS